MDNKTLKISLPVTDERDESKTKETLIIDLSEFLVREGYIGISQFTEDGVKFIVAEIIVNESNKVINIE